MNQTVLRVDRVAAKGSAEGLDGRGEDGVGEPEVCLKTGYLPSGDDLFKAEFRNLWEKMKGGVARQEGRQTNTVADFLRYKCALQRF